MKQEWRLTWNKTKLLKRNQTNNNGTWNERGYINSNRNTLNEIKGFKSKVKPNEKNWKRKIANTKITNKHFKKRLQTKNAVKKWKQNYKEKILNRKIAYKNNAKSNQKYIGKFKQKCKPNIKNRNTNKKCRQKCTKMEPETQTWQFHKHKIQNKNTI